MTKKIFTNPLPCSFADRGNINLHLAGEVEELWGAYGRLSPSILSRLTSGPVTALSGLVSLIGDIKCEIESQQG